MIANWADNDDGGIDCFPQGYMGEDPVLFRKMVIAAKVYMIAKREGRTAAMLWKLQNSG